MQYAMRRPDDDADRVRLSAFLGEHFCVDFLDEVPLDVWMSAGESAERVLANPSRFPEAQFGYLERVLEEVRSPVYPVARVAR